MTRSIFICVGLLGCHEYNFSGGELAEPPLSEPEVPVPDEAPPEGTDEPPVEPGEPVEPDLEVPTAVCEVSPSPVAALYERARWSGSGSLDPDGRPLTYSWTLVSMPAGSQQTLPVGDSTEPDRPDFLPDMVGDYIGELVVTNDLGVSSEPCEAVLEAIPATDLWVEMFWLHSGDDMDLHMVRGQGSLESMDDCYYGNCAFGGLSWGPPGPDGDPSLDIDDIPGTGPENINVQQPEAITYEVWVHDYPDSRYQPVNDVTVNIYLSGVLAWSDVRGIEGEREYEHFATVDWATQTVIPR